jgi:hypothetical protein
VHFLSLIFPCFIFSIQILGVATYCSCPQLPKIGKLSGWTLLFSEVPQTVLLNSLDERTAVEADFYYTVPRETANFSF